MPHTRVERSAVVHRAKSALFVLAGFCCLWALGSKATCQTTANTLQSQDTQRASTRPEEPETVKALIDSAEQALRTNGSDTSAILSDPHYRSIHAWPRFRTLIKTHAQTAKSSTITIVTPEEPGTPLRAKMRFVKEDGSAAVGALVYVYHTDHRGVYGSNDANIPLTGSDNNYAHLFGYAVTDADGRIEVQTIRPAGYPDSDIPSHIHLRITTPDKRSDGNEIWFEDDPRLGREALEEAARFGIVICPVTMDEKGRASIDATIKLD